MKKALTYLMTGVLAMSLSSCSSQGAASGTSGSDAESSSSEQAMKDPVRIMINTGDGIGNIAIAAEGETPVFENGITQIFETVERNSVVELDSKPGEGYQFLKWMKNDEFYSADQHITVKVDEDVNYTACFTGTLGYEGTPVDSIEKAKTFGDILGLGFHEYANDDKQFGYVFELNNTVYRAVSPLPAETIQKLFDLDYDDPDHDKKFCEIIAPVEIAEMTNLTEMIPTQSEMDQLVGKTGQELLDDGWTVTGTMPAEMKFMMEKTPFSYYVYFDGKITTSEDAEGEEMIKDLKVKAVEYDGLGNAVGF